MKSNPCGKIELQRTMIPLACVVVSVCCIVSTVRISCASRETGPQLVHHNSLTDERRLVDLRACTRFTLRFQPSALDFICMAPTGRSLLSSEEIQHLKSVETVVVQDAEAIRALAEDLASSTYKGPATGTFGTQYRIDFVCYNGDAPLVSFMSIGTSPDIGSTIQTEDGHWLSNHGIRLDRFVPEMVSFRLRVLCGYNLGNLDRDLKWHLAKEHGYPSPIEWCDAIVRGYLAKGYTTNVAIFKKNIVCPATRGKGACHYAMNPNYKSDSPADMVVLFETKAGWNQHGGPELFTFDNHDPRGGLVLLNDGTVKFIRTEEELKQLRWK